MSLLATVFFGAVGVMALWNHSITWPGRNGMLHSTGSAADIAGWVLLAGAAAMLSQFAMLMRPGKAGMKWMACIFAVWAATAAVYYAVN